MIYTGLRHLASWLCLTFILNISGDSDSLSVLEDLGETIDRNTQSL